MSDRLILNSFPIVTAERHSLEELLKLSYIQPFETVAKRPHIGTKLFKYRKLCVFFVVRRDNVTSAN